MYTELLRERDSFAGAPVYPQLLNGATATTGVVDMSLFNRIQFIGGIGTIFAGANVSAYLQQTNNSNGSGAANITGANITGILNTANQGFTIEVSATQLTARYVVGVIAETGSKHANISLFPSATDARFKPCNGSDNNTINQRTAVVSS